MEWFKIVDPQVHRDFTRSIQIVACRARRPCILTVGKFYPLTLQAFTSVRMTIYNLLFFFLFVNKRCILFFFSIRL